jgi:hypothetical protein
MIKFAASLTHLTVIISAVAIGLRFLSVFNSMMRRLAAENHLEGTKP